MTFRDILESQLVQERLQKTKKGADGTLSTGKLKAVKVKKKVYNKYLAELTEDKRAYLDEDVLADEFYLAKNSAGDIVGGFGVNYTGYITGLFGIRRGFGTKIFELTTHVSSSKLNKKAKLNLFCIGKFLRDLYKEYGFKVKEIIEWDEQYAPEHWDYNKYGRPDLYEMVLV